MASKAALAKLPRMAVQPLNDVEQSLIPVISSLLGTGTETMPVPLGTGMDMDELYNTEH